MFEIYNKNLTALMTKPHLFLIGIQIYPSPSPQKTKTTTQQQQQTNKKHAS